MKIMTRKWKLENGKEVVFPAEPFDTEAALEEMKKRPLKPRSVNFLVGPRLYDYYKKLLGL